MSLHNCREKTKQASLLGHSIHTAEHAEELRYRSRAIIGVSPPARSGAAVKSRMTHCSISVPVCPGLSIVVSVGYCRGQVMRNCKDLGRNDHDYCVWINGKRVNCYIVYY